MDAAYLLDVGGSATNPSFFELAAQKNMNDVLSPAVKFITKVLAQWYPGVFMRLLLRADEVALVVDALVQRHYLRSYSASLAENFYGMKRVAADTRFRQSVATGGEAGPAVPTDAAGAASAVAGLPALSPRQRLASFAFLVLLPYAEGKLTKRYEAMMERRRQPNTAESRFTARLRRLFLKLWPYVQVAWRGSNVAINLLCLTGLVKSFSPDLWLIGLKLDRLSRDDMQLYAGQREASLVAREDAYAATPLMRRLPSTVLNNVKDASRIAIPAGMFFLSFLSWWYNSGQQTSAAPKPVPPPPPESIKAPGGVSLPADRSICALCRAVRTNPAAIAASGFVFCYPCIYTYVQQNKRCPVSHLPATVGMLIRIHD